jgi:hypothetical protein
MSSFTKLEKAALDAIFAETPELSPVLKQQPGKAVVTNRENTGAGFFTNIQVSEDAPRMNGPRVLGYETHARIEGLTYGLGFVLFMEDGRLHLLEAYAVGPESTAPLNLEELTFTIRKTPFDA